MICAFVDEIRSSVAKQVEELEMHFIGDAKAVIALFSVKEKEEMIRRISSLYTSLTRVYEFCHCNTDGFKKIVKKCDKMVFPVVEEALGHNGSAPVLVNHPSQQLSHDFLHTLKGSSLHLSLSDNNMKLTLESHLTKLFDRDVSYIRGYLELQSCTAYKVPRVLQKEGFIIDMDGVIYHDNHLLEGAQQFINWLIKNNKKFVFLTNASDKTPDNIVEKLNRLGITGLTSSHVYTSALATAAFLKTQQPFASVYILGNSALAEALRHEGFTVHTDADAVTAVDYVVLGETRNYDLTKIEAAIRLVRRGGRLIATNVDDFDKVGEEHLPSCGALIKPIEACSGKFAYYCGKPSPMIMRSALRRLGMHSENVVIIGDRMNTDIVAGIQAGCTTVLLLSGVTRLEDLGNFSYCANYIFRGIYQLCDTSDQKK